MDRTSTHAPIVRTILRSDELTCPSCVERIDRRLGRLPGVAHTRVHFATGRIVVDHDPAAVTPDTLAATVTELGYRATPSPF